MMIMTSIILLMAIYGEFTFDSKISRIKATNIMDKSQAKLLAESGLQLALTRLKLYKEAFNKVQSNQNAKSLVTPQLINQLWEVPFVYPIPVGKEATVAFKDTVSKFENESFLQGEMRVTIENISSRMNLNLIRIRKIGSISGESAEDDTAATSVLNISDTGIMSNVSVDQSLYFLLKKLVEDKKSKDIGFEERYENLNYQELFSNLKFFISDFQSYNAPDAPARFNDLGMTPKFGPLSSGSELYSIPGWNDELIELIKNEFSVYPSTQIDLNKITANMLKILIPNITDDAISDFFLWRDDPESPKFINTKADFKRYVVDQERLMTDGAFEERMQLFEKRGITFGSNPNLFKIISEGNFNRSTYKLIAYVVLPKPDVKKPQAPQKNPDGTPIVNPTPPPAQPTDQVTQLMDPRVVEIQIN